MLGQAERLGIQAQWQLRRLGSEEVLAPEDAETRRCGRRKTWGKRGENVGKTWGKRVIYRGKLGENGEKGQDMMQNHRISWRKTGDRSMDVYDGVNVAVTTNAKRCYQGLDG